MSFYFLATGSVMQAGLPGRIRRNMPDPLPVMVLGRLAVDRACAGQGLGKALVRDAILRTVEAAKIAGIRALLVHAKDEQLAAFYRRHDFLPSSIDPLILLLPLQDRGTRLQERISPDSGAWNGRLLRNFDLWCSSAIVRRCSLSPG